MTNYISSYLDPESWAVADPDGTVTNITLENPSESPLVGDVEIISSQVNILLTSANFNLSQGDYEYCSMIVKNIDATSLTVRFRSDAGISGGNNTVNLSTMTQSSGDADFYAQLLNDEFYLLQFRYKTEVALTNCDIFAFVEGDGGQLYIQSAFFGRSHLQFPYSMYYEFNAAAEATDWEQVRCTLTASAGVASLVATDNDPIIRQTTSFQASDYYKCSVKWKRNAGTTSNSFSYRGGGALQTVPFDETNPDSRAVTTGPDGSGFYTTEIDLSNDANWEGEIAQIRFDFGADNTSNFDIEYIKIFGDELLAEYDAFLPGVAMPIL